VRLTAVRVSLVGRDQAG